MLNNIKVVYLHCVFHGIRFKVNEDWVSVIDTLLFFMYNMYYSFRNNDWLRNKKWRFLLKPPFLVSE